MKNQISKFTGVEAVSASLLNHNVRASRKMRQLILKMKKEAKNYILAVPFQLNEIGISEGSMNDNEVVKYGVYLSYGRVHGRKVYFVKLYPAKVWHGKQFVAKHEEIKLTN